MKWVCFLTISYIVGTALLKRMLMVLMRLTDAIKEASPQIGLSPHRSWWVAENGVETVKRSNGKTEIVLKSGHQVPVSRNGSKTLRDAGWK